jgi:hypothetical protein
VKLLSRKLDPNRSDWLGRTLLNAVTERGDPALVSLFQKAATNINAAIEGGTEIKR